MTPDIFEHVNSSLGSIGDNEFYLTTYGLDPMIRAGKGVYACRLSNSNYYDTGNKLEYIKTVIDFALDREDISKEVRDHIRSKI